MKVNPEIILREEFDGSAFLFNPDDGQIFGLNPTAKFIWKSLARDETPEQILAGLAEHSASPLPPEAEKDLNDFLLQPQDKGYLSRN